LVVACTKSDKIAVKSKKILATSLKQLEDMLLGQLREWPNLFKVPHDILFVTTKTSETVEKFKECLGSLVLEMANRPVPSVFRHAVDCIGAINVPSKFFPPLELKKVCSEKFSRFFFFLLVVSFTHFLFNIVIS
jgi:hypothetical protein